MNERERFIAAMTFNKPDKYPFEPGSPRESTLAAWHQQGLPLEVDWHTYLWQLLGLEDEGQAQGQGQAQGLPRRIGLDVDFHLLPTFEEKVLEHREGHYVVQDWMGAVTEISDAYDYTYIRNAKDFVTRHWHSFPVRTRQDWEEKIRWRYQIDSPGRFPEDFSTRCASLRQRDYPIRLDFAGPFWQMREWIGFEGLCQMLADEPEFIQEMVTFWSDFVSRMLERILEQVTPDIIQVSEDMAYKIHSMISPAMTRRYLVPAWRRWGELIKASGCPVYSMDSDGYIAELIPMFIEAGFNATWPVEVAAGNDIVAFRSKYGRQLALGGGIDKRALAAGGEGMRTELLRVVPPLLELGGCLPGCDHGVPADVSWPYFVEYSQCLAEMLGWRGNDLRHPA